MDWQELESDMVLVQKQIIDILKKIKIPWSVNALAQEAGVTAICQNKESSKKAKILLKKNQIF